MVAQAEHEDGWLVHLTQKYTNEWEQHSGGKAWEVKGKVHFKIKAP